jgi:hypothetical protein
MNATKRQIIEWLLKNKEIELRERDWEPTEQELKQMNNKGYFYRTYGEEGKPETEKCYFLFKDDAEDIFAHKTNSIEEANYIVTDNAQDLISQHIRHLLDVICGNHETNCNTNIWRI